MREKALYAAVASAFASVQRKGIREHVNRYSVAASTKYRCVLIARIHIGNLICFSSRLAFRAKSRVSSCAARKYPAVIPQRRTEMQYLGARLILSLSHIVHIEKRCPININPRARLAVRADTILIDQREIRTRHIPNRRKQGKSIRSGSKRTHLRRDFSDRLHAIAIANMLRKRFRWGWWELGTSSRGLLLQIATESNYEERSWLRKIVEIYAWPLFVISQRKQIKMRIFICTNHKNLFFFFY